MNVLKTALASAALASFTLAQPALAETRSYQSLPQTSAYSAASVERVGAVAGESETLGGGSPALIVILVFGALLGLGFAAGIFDSDSPG